jgi:hypothetical protein
MLLVHRRNFICCWLFSTLAVEYQIGIYGTPEQVLLTCFCRVAHTIIGHICSVPNGSKVSKFRAYRSYSILGVTDYHYYRI